MLSQEFWAAQLGALVVPRVPIAIAATSRQVVDRASWDSQVDSIASPI